MNFKKKSIPLLVVVSCLIPIFLLIIIKIFFFINFEESKLRKIATDFCKIYLDKAVKFEEIYIDYTGNLVLLKFDLSNTSDFNDGLSLLMSEKISISLNFFDLFYKIIKIKNINFYNSTITIHKQYGKDHNENIKNIITFKKELKDLSYIDLKNLSITVKNSEIYYKEIFKDKKLTVGCNNLQAYFNFKGEKLQYDIKGRIIPHKTRGIINGKFIFNGHIFQDTKNYFTHLIIENFDLSYLNDFFTEYKVIDNTLQGGLSTNFKINSDDKKISLNGNIDINNFDLLSYIQPQFKIISNKNFNIDIDLDFIKKDNIFNISKFKLFDDHLSIDSVGKYIENKKQENALFSFKTNHMDLNKLNEFFTPIKDISYNGKLLINGEFDIDLKNQKLNNINANLILEDFNSECFIGGKKEKIFTDTKLKFAVDKKSITSSGAVRLFQSDFMINMNTVIKDWHPIKSETSLLINSKIVEFGLLFDAFNKTINYIYYTAYEDNKKGYDPVLFLQTPVSKTLSANDLSIKYDAGMVKIYGNAKLDGFSFNSDFKNGVFSLKNFKLSGYNAQYNAEFLAYFNRDYPYVGSKGSVKNFNIEDFSKDLGKNFIFSGSGSLEYEFELSAYRMSQLLDNTEGSLSISILGGILKNSDFQKKINSYFEDNEHRNFDFNEIIYQNFSLSFTQRGENFFIGNFILNSDNINFNAYGKYNYNDGVDLNLYASIYDKDKKINNIPFKIIGPLLSPEMTMKIKKDTKKIILFHVD